MSKAPEGKFMGMVKVGEKGQIVIPKGARDLFGIQSGDTLVLLADIERGIAIVKSNVLDDFMADVLRMQESSPETAQ